MEHEYENTQKNLQEREELLTKQYEEASRRVETLQKASVNLPGGYHRCTMEKGIPFAFVSKSFEQIVGYTKEQLEKELDNKFVNLIYEEDLPHFEGIEEILKEKGRMDKVYRIRRRDGEIRWVQDSVLVVDWEGSRCLQCTLSDITEFVTQQQATALAKAELEELAQNVPCGYHRCSTEDGFRLEFVSDSFLETVGYEKKEVLGKSFMELIAPEDRAFFLSHEEELTKNGRVELVYRVMRKDGSYRWIKDSTTRIVHGGKASYQCILADITDFVLRQEEIQKKNFALMQEKSLTEVIEKTMPGGYHRCRADKGCPFTYIGGHFTDIVGFTKEEIERDFDNLYVNLLWEEDKGAISTYEEMIAMRGKGNVYDNSIYRLKHKDGGYRWVSDSTMFVDMGEESFFQAVISDVTSYIEDLNAAKKEAEASNQAKSTFLFNASHDIRTPMNAIKGFAHIIEQNADDVEIVKETVRKIQAASETLMTLMNDILDLARIERGKEEIKEEVVDVYSHSKNLYEMFSASMKAAGIEFVMETKETFVRVLCDPLKLSRIGMNMLSNAKKFTPAGGKVSFGAEQVGIDDKRATYRFFVKDTGIGMSEEFQRRAFEEFERERTSTESGISGSGLGLAIMKKLVSLMGGEIAIQSELGKGTEISATISFPLVNEEEIKGKHEGVSEADMTGKRVLLVEDNEFNREIARYILEDLRFEVDEAENGLVCVKKVLSAGAGYYDLILMDVQMPIMDGYRATEEIRRIADKKIASVPIIAMTANAFDEDRKKCLAVGMDGHVGKPIEIQVLLREIATVESKRGER